MASPLLLIQATGMLLMYGPLPPQWTDRLQEGGNLEFVHRQTRATSAVNLVASAVADLATHSTRVELAGVLHPDEYSAKDWQWSQGGAAMNALTSSLNSLSLGVGRQGVAWQELAGVYARTALGANRVSECS